MECEVDPLAPEIVTGNTPVAAVFETEKLTACLLPGWIVTGDAGLEVTPDGNFDTPETQ